jgi:hypothetical protein
VTRALALHLRSPGSAASSEAGSSIIQWNLRNNDSGTVSV